MAAARRACELADWKEAAYLDALAAAYAEVGDFEQAVLWQTKAIELLGDKATVPAGLNDRLKLYQDGYPYRETGAGRQGVAAQQTTEPPQPAEQLKANRPIDAESAKDVKQGTAIEQPIGGERNKVLEKEAAEQEPKQLHLKQTEAHLKQAVAAFQQGDIDGTIEHCTEAIRLNPQHAKAYFTRSVAHQVKGDLDKAMTDCTDAIRLEPLDAMFYAFRGALWATQGKHDRAIADFDEAIRLNPNLAPVYVDRGQAWKLMGNFDRAIRDYEAAIDRDPGYADAYDPFAFLLATCPDARYRDGERAVQLATKACELAGWRNAKYLDSLAAACAETGDFEAAIKWQKKAIELGPGLEEYKSRLALYRDGRPFRIHVE